MKFFAYIIQIVAAVQLQVSPAQVGRWSYPQCAVAVQKEIVDGYSKRFDSAVFKNNLSSR